MVAAAAASSFPFISPAEFNRKISFSFLNIINLLFFFLMIEFETGLIQLIRKKLKLRAQKSAKLNIEYKAWNG